MERFGTEERWAAAPDPQHWLLGFVCPSCRHAAVCMRLRTRALPKCQHSHHQMSIAAGTILEAMKLPLRTWFPAKYVLSERKNAISALALKRRQPVGLPVQAPPTST
jgi:hypothetical protein